MALDPNVLAALASMPEALASYIQSSVSIQASPVAPMPITAAPVAPAPVAPVVAAPVVATVVPTPEIVIQLVELKNERPKKAGFLRFVDGRPNLSKDFDHKTEAARPPKQYISPLWIAGREDNLEMAIRERPQPGFAWVLTKVS